MLVRKVRPAKQFFKKIGIFLLCSIIAGLIACVVLIPVFVEIQEGRASFTLERFNLDKNLDYIENGTYAQKVHGNLKYVKNFLDRLKKNNAYDNSVIVVMADHGYGNTNVANIFYRMNPLLIIKGINEHHEVVISDKAISYTEVNSALVELIDGKKSSDLFKDIPSKRKRTVLWYHFTKENHMVEYTTTGKASDITKFKKTGRVFDWKG